MAPTTLLDKWPLLHPTGGRQQAGYPLKMAELLAQNQGSAYIYRTAVNNPANVIRTKKSIEGSADAPKKKALQWWKYYLPAPPIGIKPPERDMAGRKHDTLLPLGWVRIKEDG